MLQQLFKPCFGGLILFALAFIAAGCDSSTTHNHASEDKNFTFEGSGPLKVVATTGMVADLVKNVGKDNVQVTALMGAGVDPHLYKPTPGDIKKLRDADIVFYNGLHLEGKMADVLERMGERKPTIPVASRIEKAKLLDNPDPQYARFPDPHVWFDVRLWKSGTDVVRDALTGFDRRNETAYKTNAAAYSARLDELDSRVRKQIASIPESQRVLVTAHDAFSYFGKAYNIEVRGLQGISTATEASLQDVNRIVEMLIKRNVKAVFVESSVPRRNIEAVVKGARARGHDVKVGGELFSDAMGAPNTPEGTYIGMVESNARTIADALK